MPPVSCTIFYEQSLRKWCFACCSQNNSPHAFESFFYELNSVLYADVNNCLNMNSLLDEGPPPRCAGHGRALTTSPHRWVLNGVRRVLWSRTSPDIHSLLILAVAWNQVRCKRTLFDGVQPWMSWNSPMYRKPQFLEVATTANNFCGRYCTIREAGSSILVMPEIGLALWLELGEKPILRQTNPTERQPVDKPGHVLLPLLLARRVIWLSATRAWGHFSIWHMGAKLQNAALILMRRAHFIISQFCVMCIFGGEHESSKYQFQFKISLYTVSMHEQPFTAIGVHVFSTFLGNISNHLYIILQYRNCSY